MANNISKKHHFIPVFYQKGFCSDSGELFAYKKEMGGIKDWSPSQILYEKHLHTVSFGNEKTSMIEELLSQVEGEFKKYLDLIKDNFHDPYFSDLLHDEDFQRVMKLVVSMQFWRTPCKKELAFEYSKGLLEQFDKAGGVIKEMLGFDRKLIKFLQRRASKDDSIKFIQFIVLPLLTFDLSTKAAKFKLLKAVDGESFVSTDRPVSFSELESLFQYKSFSFPISKDFLLVGTDKKMESIDTLKFNQLMARRARNVVFSGSRSQLYNVKSYLESQAEG